MLRKTVCLISAFIASFGLQAFAQTEEETAVKDLQSFEIVDNDTTDLRLDDAISKAEAIKMICVALSTQNETYTADDAFFKDVPQTHWAFEYIKAGYAKKIIDGDAGYFYPEKNVTSTEMQKMLVCALGYKDWSDAIGYPDGYLNWANSIGIVDNISEDNERILTRGEAMVMMRNALDAPLLVVYLRPVDGGYEAGYVICDGEGYLPFRSLRMILSGEVTE